MVKNSFSEPKNQQKSNISKSVCFKKIPAHRFAGLICANKLEGFFFFEKFFFQGLGAFFTTAARLIWASFFSTKKYCILFFKGDYLIFMYCNIENML